MRTWLGSLWLLTLLQAGCETIDVGEQLAEPLPCRASSSFFISDVWPKYFERYSCGRSDCHAASTGHGFFRLQDVSAVLKPQPTDSVALWPQPWVTNLRAIEQNLSCANPLSSLVLSVPSERSQPHPPGKTVTDQPEADALFTAWIK